MNLFFSSEKCNSVEEAITEMRKGHSTLEYVLYNNSVWYVGVNKPASEVELTNKTPSDFFTELVENFMTVLNKSKMPLIITGDANCGKSIIESALVTNEVPYHFIDANKKDVFSLCKQLQEHNSENIFLDISANYTPEIINIIKATCDNILTRRIVLHRTTENIDFNFTGRMILLSKPSLRHDFMIESLIARCYHITLEKA